MSRTPEELRNAFWEEDAQRGCVIRSQYEEIKEVLEKKDVAWTYEKYRAIKKHAIEQTKYYKNYSVDDEFPVVDKTSILSNYEDHKAQGGFEYPVHISSTSGSTGTPFSVVQDYRKRMRTIADLKVFGERCDYPSHERMLFFRGTTNNRTAEQEERENIYYIDCGNLGEDNLEHMSRAIVDKKPRIIFSYSSTLVEIAKYIKRMNLKGNFSVRAALVAGEGLYGEDRLLLEEVFGCPVYRRYSDMELGILAQDMGEGGIYHINWGSYYVEFLKIDRDEPAEQGESCRIVITDLFNKAMPMIRYDTGDIGVLGYEDGIPVLTEIYGKRMDCVYTTTGDLVSPHKLEILLWGLEGVKQWQFIQDDKCYYRLRINGERDRDYADAVQRFQKYLGEDAVISIDFVEEIPTLASNKRRMVVCNYKKEN